jgi:hypothetical protein
MASRGTSTWMKETWGKACRPDIVAMPFYAGGPRFQCDRRVRPAFAVLGGVFLKWGYIVRSAGCYVCRANTSNPAVPSNHSWGTAIDVNPDTNPYRHDKLVTDMPAGMIAEIEGLRTVDGVTLFRWGGRYSGAKDAMHFEVMATPEELAAGIPALPGAHTVPTEWPVIRRGAVGPAVVELQSLLGLQATTGSGTFGPRTEEAVRLYQKSRGLTEDGIVGHGTWTALLTHQPIVLPGGITPLKQAA